MKLLNIFLFFTILLKTCVATEHNLDGDNKDNSLKKTINPIIYQIYKENTDTENPTKILLVGSMHILPPSAVDEEIKQLITSGTILLIERFNINTSIDASFLYDYADVPFDTLLMKGYFDQDYSSWLDRLSKESTQWIEDHDLAVKFKRMWGIEWAHIPPSIISYIAEKTVWQEFGKLVNTVSSNPPETIDYYVLQKYQNVIGLENGLDCLTISGELDKRATEEVQHSIQVIETSITALKSFNTTKEQEIIKEVTDITSLRRKQWEEALVSGDLSVFDPLINEQVVKRNQLWLPKITKIIDVNPSASITIMVGAAHLGGEYGLLNLLTQAGYTVKKVD